METLGWARQTLHRRYVRAAALGLCLVTTICSLGALHLRLRHDVSFLAVARYFTRDHLAEGDLTALLRNRESGSELESLARADDFGWVAGMVYASDGRLTFHPHANPELRKAWRTEGVNRDVYSRLVPLYHRGALEELLGELAAPAMRDGLVERGLDPGGLESLANETARARTEQDRTLLLRRTGFFLQPFTPSGLSPSWLEFGDRLRFYEEPEPAGDFVGQFAVLDAGWAPHLDEEEALGLSRRSHYLLVAPVGDRILIFDFYRGRVRRYDLRPFDHRTGNRLYHLAVAG